MIDRHDFDRGRRAIAVLQGRRTTLGDRSHRFQRSARLAVAAVVASSALLLAVAIVANGDGDVSRAPSTESSPDRPGVVVQAHSPSPSIIPAVSHAFTSWEEAENAVPWAVAPERLPAGYELSALQGFAAPFGSGDIDSIVAIYLSSSGMLTIDQFYIARPEAFDIALTLPQHLPPEVSSGEVRIGDGTGYWSGAVIVEDPVGEARVDRDAIVLTWAEGTNGYRVTGRGVNLETLLTIAESMAH